MNIFISRMILLFFEKLPVPDFFQIFGYGSRPIFYFLAFRIPLYPIFQVDPPRPEKIMTESTRDLFPSRHPLRGWNRHCLQLLSSWIFCFS